MTGARLNEAGNRYDGEYLTAVWNVLANERHGRIGRPPKIEVKTSVPIGGGLSSSSALTICLVQACLAHLGELEPPKAEIVRIAYEAELRITNGGGMDQLAIMLGGVTYIEGRERGVPALLSRRSWPAKWSLLVIDPRKPKSTRNHIERVRKQYSRNDPRLQQYIQRTDAIAGDIWASLVDEDLDAFAQAMNGAHDAMRDIQDMSTNEIELIRKVALDCGCPAVKLSGAGSGGCIVGVVSADTAEEILESFHRRVRKDHPMCSAYLVSAFS